MLYRLNLKGRYLKNLMYIKNNMNKKLITLANVVIILALPVVSFAFYAGTVPNAVQALSVNTLIDIVFSIIWPVVVAFSIVMLILAAFTFMTARGDADKAAQARQEVIWGVVGIAVALIAFSIPFVVRNTLNGGLGTGSGI